MRAGEGVDIGAQVEGPQILGKLPRKRGKILTLVGHGSLPIDSCLGPVTSKN